MAQVPTLAVSVVVCLSPPSTENHGLAGWGEFTPNPWQPMPLKQVTAAPLIKAAPWQSWHEENPEDAVGAFFASAP
jgi:hypothetical protein